MTNLAESLIECHLEELACIALTDDILALELLLSPLDLHVIRAATDPSYCPF